MAVLNPSVINTWRIYGCITGQLDDAVHAVPILITAIIHPYRIDGCITDQLDDAIHTVTVPISTVIHPHRINWWVTGQLGNAVHTMSVLISTVIDSRRIDGCVTGQRHNAVHAMPVLVPTKVLGKGIQTACQQQQQEKTMDKVGFHLPGAVKELLMDIITQEIKRMCSFSLGLPYSPAALGSLSKNICVGNIGAVTTNISIIITTKAPLTK